MEVEMKIQVKYASCCFSSLHYDELFFGAVVVVGGRWSVLSKHYCGPIRGELL